MQETKKDASFPDAQFLKPGYRKPYRKTIITMVRGLFVRKTAVIIFCCDFSLHITKKELQLGFILCRMVFLHHNSKLS